MKKSFVGIFLLIVFFMGAESATLPGKPDPSSLYRGLRLTPGGGLVSGTNVLEAQEQYPFNVPNIHKKTKITIRGGQLFTVDGHVLDTKGHPGSSVHLWLWIMDKKRDLYVGFGGNGIDHHMSHSYFRKTKRGWGKSIMCGGHIEANENGKITYIDNASGHYMPTTDQFLLCMHYLSLKNVFAENAVIYAMTAGRRYSLQEIKEINPEEILSRYKTKEELGVETSGSEGEED
jgi:hypothetical protein